MRFVDDVVLLGESYDKLNGRLKTWGQTLEVHVFRLSRRKTKYIECNFNKMCSSSTLEVKAGDHIIRQVT